MTSLKIFVLIPHCPYTGKKTSIEVKQASLKLMGSNALEGKEDLGWLILIS